MKKDKIKVLVVIDNLNKGGIVTAVNNFCSLFNKDEIIFDFVTYVEPTGKIAENIKSNDGKIFIIKRVTKTNPVSYILSIKRIIKNNGPYKAIHLHTAYFIWLGAVAAKIGGIKNIVGHAHGSQWLKSSIFIRIVESIGRKMNILCCTERLACAEKSGQYTFGKKYNFMPNVVSYNQNVIDTDIHRVENEFKKQSSKIKIGYLGIFSNVKNTEFIVELANYMKSKSEFVFLAAGDGIDFDKVKNKALNYNLNNILFLGYRNDNYELLKFFDVLVVPSISEGMSLSILESQILGTPIVASKGVPDTNNIKSGLFFKTNTYDFEEWYEKINIAIENKTKYSIEEIDRILKDIKYDKEHIKSVLYECYSRN